MRIALTAALVATLALPGCGAVRDSAFNPFNWFGKSRAERLEGTERSTNPLIPKRSAFARPKPSAYEGETLSQVLDLRIERAPGGAIVRVRGLASTLGAYDVRIVPDFEEDAGPQKTLEFTLKAKYDARSRPTAPSTSREVVAALFLTDEELAGVRSIRVKAAQNARVSRR